VSDVLFVVAGGGTVVAGGAMEGDAPLPGMPGEMRGRAMKGGQTYQLAAGAVIDIPPSTPYQVRAGSSGLTAMRPRSTRACTRGRSSPRSRSRWRRRNTSRSRHTGQRGIARRMCWSPIDYSAHRSLSAAADRGQPFNDPRLRADSRHPDARLQLPAPSDGRQQSAARCRVPRANTDIYFILAGAGR
jgi:hypothetical protein